MRIATVVLLLLASFIGARVEILNARAGSPLPLRKSLADSESGFDSSQRLRYSLLGHDKGWERVTDPELLARREVVQRKARHFNELLDFGRYWSLLQFPLVLALAILLAKTLQRYRGAWPKAAWITMAALVLFLTILAVYRDYSYGTYGM